MESLRDPFVDMMKSEALLTRTENGAATYAASGNPLVDFFFQASPHFSAQPVVVSVRQRGYQAQPDCMTTCVPSIC